MPITILYEPRSNEVCASPRALHLGSNGLRSLGASGGIKTLCV